MLITGSGYLNQPSSQMIQRFGLFGLLKSYSTVVQEANMDSGRLNKGSHKSWSDFRSSIVIKNHTLSFCRGEWLRIEVNAKTTF